MIWFVNQLIKRKDTAELDKIVVLLLRQIRNPGNDVVLDMVHDLLYSNREYVMSHPHLLAVSVFVFLRTIPQIFNGESSSSFEKLETFVCSAITEQADICILIGRDLIRAFYDVVNISKRINSLFVSMIHESNVVGFTRLTRVLSCTTPKEFIATLIPFDADEDIRFIVETEIISPSLYIYSQWLGKLYFWNEYMIADILRYILHPQNQVHVDGTVSLIREIMKTDDRTTSRHSLSIQMSLIFDWICFTGENIKKIEPSAILLFNSLTDKDHLPQAGCMLNGLATLFDENHSSLSQWFRKNVSSCIEKLDKYGYRFDDLLESSLIDEGKKDIVRNLFSTIKVMNYRKLALDDDDSLFKSAGFKQDPMDIADADSVMELVYTEQFDRLDNLFEYVVKGYSLIYRPKIIEVIESIFQDGGSRSDILMLRFLVYCFRGDLTRVSVTYPIVRNSMVIAEKDWLVYLSKLAETDFDTFIGMLHRFLRFIPGMTGNIDFIQKVLCGLDVECMYKLLTRQSLGEFSLFITDEDEFIASVDNIGTVTCAWDSLEQTNFWALVRIEIMTFPQVHKIIINDDVLQCLSDQGNAELHLGVFQALTARCGLIEYEFTLEFIVKCYERHSDIAGNLLKFFIVKNNDETVNALLKFGRDTVETSSKVRELILLVDECTLIKKDLPSGESGLNRFGKILYRNPDIEQMMTRLRNITRH